MKKQIQAIELAAWTCGAVMMGVATDSWSQIQPPTQQRTQLSEKSLPITDRGTALDVYVAPRATVSTSTSGRLSVKAMTRATADSPISASQRGIVYNRDARQYGFISGEISFRLKDSAKATPNWFKTFSPTITRLGSLNLYVVNAATVTEFVQTMSALNSNPDIESVEPIVTYGADPANALGTIR